MESFASFALMEPTWNAYGETKRKLHADASIKIDKELTVKGEFVERCEGITYEGEIGDWTLFDRGFFFIQASDLKGNICVFMVEKKDSILFLKGMKTEIETLNLKNILVWDEWK
jgi:hypothetical protein